jgi:hypothetical protein
MTDPTPFYDAATIRPLLGSAFTGAGETKYPDDMLDDLIAEFRSLVEFSDFGLGVAFSPTETTEVLTARYGPLIFSYPKVTAVSAVSYTDGLGPDVDAETGVQLLNSWSLGLLPEGTAWPCGRRVSVTYTHGYEEPPAAILRGCRLYVKNEASAEKSSRPAAAASVDADVSGYGYSFETPGPGKPTRWPDVNAALRAVPSERVPGMA